MSSHKLEELMIYLGAHPQVSNLGPTKLWKLIYFIEARALRTHGHSITGSEFIKYEHGPVPSRGDKFLKSLIKKELVSSTSRLVGGKTLNEIKSARRADLGIFSREELTVIDGVCGELGSQSAMTLSELSHQEPAWHYAEKMEKLSPELMLYGVEEDAEGL